MYCFGYYKIEVMVTILCAISILLQLKMIMYIHAQVYYSTLDKKHCMQNGL